MKVGLPRDPGQWMAVAAAALAIAVLPGRLVPAAPRRRRVWIASLAVVAAALSAAYVTVYLRGGPRIIDATSYWLEARALSHGLLAWAVPEPSASIVGRFLVRAPSGTAAVIFPPGYPALLSLGFALGAPLAVGPALAAALVMATTSLAERVEGRDVDRPASRPDVVLLAALFSVVCAALRYHSADTMSHGLAALCFTSALAATLAALDRRAPKSPAAPALAAGFFAGWLLATRPVSAVALALGMGLALLRERSLPLRERALIAAQMVAGAAPGALLLAAHQHAATGAMGASSQSLYYALSDGPPGCFAYGFGTSIGCLGEHGDFVRARLAGGYGAFAALGTTLRRLWIHLLDIANAEPLGLLVPAGVWVARRSARARLLAVCAGLQIALYAPFYFDGNYPGGGARFYADVLPLEHVVAALAVAAMAERARSPRAAGRVAASIVALACVGFAVRAGFDHASLRDREGGLPMFEPARLASAGVTRGVLFLTTDHGYDLAYDPAPGAPIDVLRLRGDALDRLAWEARGRPEAHVYDFKIPEAGVAQVTIVPLSFDASGPIPIEGESLWPPVGQAGGWALPEYTTDPCASHGRWLRVRRAASARVASIDLALPARLLAGSSLAPRIALSRPGIAALRIVLDGETVTLRAASAPTAPSLCQSLAAFDVPAKATELRLILEFTGDDADLFALDALGLTGKTD